MKPKPIPDENCRIVEKIVTPPEKRRNIERINTIIRKLNNTKYLNY